MTIKYLDKYPKNLAKSLWVVKPSWTVFKLFCKTVVHRPVTVLYPYEKEWVPDNYRGRPGLRFDKCGSTWAGAPCADTAPSTVLWTP